MPRILHIGVGNFHRAHQAIYTADAGADWRITGVVMSNTALFDFMSESGGYDIGIRGENGAVTRKIAVHDRMILARRDPEGVVDAFVDPDLHVVTLTITEKGYCLDPATDMLDLSNPAISADLDGKPKSAIGLLAYGLAARSAAGLPPLTVISCDNLSGNGGKLESAIYTFADKAGLTLDTSTCFPNTMVDRITPATSGVSEPVITEDFTEWVIEDRFAGPRPDWESAGAEFTQDVAPFEMRKLRLLNAAHSWLAYAGQLAGYSYVHEAMADPKLKAAVDRLWDEAQMTLPDVVQSSTASYRAALVDRFAVADMRHALAQIGADGSLKLRERIVPLISSDHSTPQAREAVAAWISFVLRKQQLREPLIDPNANVISEIIKDTQDTAGVCSKLVELIGVLNPTDDWMSALVQQVQKYLENAVA